jgi:hypothetical protein
MQQRRWQITLEVIVSPQKDSEKDRKHITSNRICQVIFDFPQIRSYDNPDISRTDQSNAAAKTPGCHKRDNHFLVYYGHIMEETENEFK